MPNIECLGLSSLAAPVFGEGSAIFFEPKHPLCLTQIMDPDPNVPTTKGAAVE